MEKRRAVITLSRNEDRSDNRIIGMGIEINGKHTSGGVYSTEEVFEEILYQVKVLQKMGIKCPTCGK